MGFRDYSPVPSGNTALGGELYIGPNMDRNNVRPALQQLAADGKTLADVVLPTGALAGKFLAWDAQGKPVPATGTGADGGLRADLAADTGAELIALPGGGTVADVKRSKQLDAFLSGLSGDFSEDATATLADLLAQAGKDGRDVGGRAHLPRGQYKRTATLQVSNYSVLSGDGPHATILQSWAGGSPEYPILTNADPAGANFQLIRDLALWGGTSGYRIDATGGCDDLRFQDVLFFGQTVAGIECERLLQTSEFRNVEFNACARGIWSKDATANAIHGFGVAFKNLTDNPIELNGSEDFALEGVRIEGAAAPGKAAVRLAGGANHVILRNAYIEAGPQYLVDGTGAGPSVVVFDGVHFTYYQAGTPYGFVNTDNVQLVFRNCHSTIPFEVPATAILEGANPNLYKTLPGIASATTITLPRGQRAVTITGNSDIGAITGGANYIGGPVTLLFTGALTLLDIANGGNCRLAGGANFTATANDTLSLVHDGTVWIETCRSVN